MIPVNRTRWLMVTFLFCSWGLVACARPTVPTQSSQDHSPKSASTSPANSSTLSDAWKAYRNHDVRKAIRILENDTATGHDPDRLTLLGLAHYELDEFQRSHRYWEQLIPRLQPSKQLDRAQSYERRTGRLSELNLTAHSYNHFRVLVPAELDKGVADDVNQALERAYQSVGGDLGHYPEGVLSVIVHRPGPYRRVVDAPIWSGGLFDGKIHLKYDADGQPTFRRRTLVHEFTHALVHDRSRNNLPLWFNEGLATFMEYRHSDREFRYQRLPEQRPRQTLRYLGDIDDMFKEGSGDGGRVRLGYEFSYSLIEFMKERYGLQTINHILRETGDTSSFESALLAELNLSPERLRFAWESWVSNRFQYKTGP